MKFKIDINLDDTMEATTFIAMYGTAKGRRVANALNIRGAGSELLATALANYAWNKITAIHLRESGNIAIALRYEELCNHIYTHSIHPVCECW